jgi:hypothetical protein
MRRLSWLAIPVFCASLSAAPAAKFSFADANGKLTLADAGKPVFIYNYGPVLGEGFPETMRRSTYLHPVWLPDGRVITDDFNKDHPHHRGISWMWPVVVVDGKTYDLWTVAGIRQRFLKWTARETKGGRARLGVRNGWFVDERKVVDEQVEIIAEPVKDGARVLHLLLRFEPTAEPVEIAGTPEGNKGFGGICFRLAPRDGGKDRTVIRSEKGVAKADGVNEPHRWAQVEGSFAGRPGGARLEDDPANPGYPENGWLLRHGFGFLNVSYPGLNHLRLERGKPLVLRYNVTLYSGAPPAE